MVVVEGCGSHTRLTSEALRFRPAGLGLPSKLTTEGFIVTQDLKSIETEQNG